MAEVYEQVVEDFIVSPVLESKGEEGLLKVLAWSGMTVTDI